MEIFYTRLSVSGPLFLCTFSFEDPSLPLVTLDLASLVSYIVTHLSKVEMLTSTYKQIYIKIFVFWH